MNPRLRPRYGAHANEHKYGKQSSDEFVSIRVETRSSPESFAATLRGFTFYVAHAVRFHSFVVEAIN